MAIDPTNYINTWNNSSVLQGQFPDVNDYIDLFRSSYTPFTSSTSSTPSTSSESGVGSLMEPKIINTDDSGDQGTPPGGNTNAGYGYSGVGGFSLADIAEGTVAAKDQTLSMKVDDAITGAKATFNNIGPGAKAIGSGLLSFMTKSPFSPIGVINYGYKFAKENVNRIQEEKAAAEAAAEAAKIESIRSFYDSFGRDYGQGRATQSAMDSYGTDPETGNPGNYDQDNDMKDGGRVGFAEGGSYWQTVQEAYDSAGGQDGTGLGFFDFADMYFPNPMANGGIVSLAGGGGVGYPPLQEGDRNAIPKGSKFRPPIYYNPETGTDIGIAPYRVVIDPKQEQSKRYIGTQEQPKRPIKIKDVVPETGLGFEINKGKFTGGVQAPFTKSGLGSANYGIKYSNNPSSSISADYGKDDGLQFRYRKQFEPGGGINSLFRKK